MTAALLALATGDILRGVRVGTVGMVCGELVFNTAQTGYQEILTDPSYAGQIITFTQPHIGNTGVNSEDYESNRVYARGLVVRHFEQVPSSWRSEQGLHEFLLQHQVTGIGDVDTRFLARLLREHGALGCCIDARDNPDVEAATAAAAGLPSLQGANLTTEVGHDSFASKLVPAQCSSRPMLVNVVDYGVKRNILRLLAAAGCTVRLLPATATAEDILANKPDGVLLANGPGDPAACTEAVATVKRLLQHDVPVFGICLGCQLLALAVGATTVKMKFGHHGANHPVQSNADGLVLISSQNHGFAVAEQSLPDGWRVSHRSLFDGSLQGIECVDRPLFGFQGHPEASPGPHDARSIFSRFTEAMVARDV